MGQKLHALGAFAFKRPFLIISIWVAILAILGFTASQFIKPTSSAISIPGTEAQKALDRMSTLFPAAGAGSARVVFAAPEGKTIEQVIERPHRHLLARTARSTTTSSPSAATSA